MWPRDLPSTYVNFSCGRKTFRELLSTLHTARRASINFSQLSVRPGDFLSTFIIFHFSHISFCQLPYGWETVHQLPSTFLTAGWPSVTFCQHSLRPSVSRLHKKLTVSIPAARKFDASTLKVSRPHGRFKKGHLSARKLDGT